MLQGKISPEKYIGDYVISKQNVLPQRKYCEELEGPDIALEHHRREFYETERHLKKKREEYKEKRVHMDAQWGEAAAEGQKLKDNFVNFNQFLIVNMEKRKRATENRDDTKKLIKQREEAIKDFSSRVEILEASKRKLDDVVASFSIYEKYLFAVVDASAKIEGFKNVDAILERFEYYDELARDFAKKLSDDFQTLQNAKNQLSNFNEINEDVLLGLHTQAAGLLGRYEDVQRNTRRLETLVYRIKESARQKYFDIRNTTESIWNLYRLMCRNKNLTMRIDRSDILNQLIFISRMIKLYHYLNIEMVKIMRKTPLKGLK